MSQPHNKGKSTGIGDNPEVNKNERKANPINANPKVHLLETNLKHIKLVISFKAPFSLTYRMSLSSVTECGNMNYVCDG